MNTVTQALIDMAMEQSETKVIEVFDKVTIVSIKLLNGFVITESSACVDPINYDKEMGIAICKKRIEQRLWELEGFALQNFLHYNRNQE